MHYALPTPPRGEGAETWTASPGATASGAPPPREAMYDYGAQAQARHTIGGLGGCLFWGFGFWGFFLHDLCLFVKKKQNKQLFFILRPTLRNTASIFPPPKRTPQTRKISYLNAQTSLGFIRASSPPTLPSALATDWVRLLTCIRVSQ